MPAGDTPALLAALPAVDVLVVLGGDGTFLRAARAVAETRVPMVGVNLGKIGFLSKAEAHELEDLLAKIDAGQYRLEDRMALSGAIHGERGDPARHSFVALNDVVIARGALARVVHLDVEIGPSHLATYVADGLIVASPTGSTGYSFSAGGPILDPVSRNLIVTPIAAYLSALGSVVVSPDQVVRCRVVRGSRGPGLRRRARGLPDRGRGHGDGRRPRAADPLPRAGRGDSVLGPAAAEGPAASLVMRP